MISPELHVHIPELVTVLGTLHFLMAFTHAQREWIIERDGYECQATVPHDCNQEEGIEVDHIAPQRYCATLNPPIDPDFPENALSKCKNSHNIKHPDRLSALYTYHQAKAEGIDTFQELFAERKKKLENHQIYWNPENDRTDSMRAIQLTQWFQSLGRYFPLRRRR